jgi:thioesterase domain-containing protein
VTAIEQEVGHSLSVATLLDARTVRELAEVVERQRAAPAWKALVVMQPKGRKPPFFCVHGVGGEVVGYEALAARMGTDRPFIAVQATEEPRHSDPALGIAAQASAYIEEIRRYQPEGPYHLGGYSHGGRVALEMALQLEAQGQRVAFLGILDTTPFRVYYKSPRYWLRVAANAPRWFWYDALRTPWRENLDRVYRGARMLRRLLRLGRGGRTLWADVRDTLNIDPLPPAFQERYQWDFQAFSLYHPQKRFSPITVFRAAAQPLLATHDPDLGWNAVSSEPVAVITVRGNHSSILVEPDVRGLAVALRTALDRAASARSG